MLEKSKYAAVEAGSCALGANRDTQRPRGRARWCAFQRGPYRRSLSDNEERADDYGSRCRPTNPDKHSQRDKMQGLSAFTAGAVLLVLVVFLGDWVAQIPMPALVAIMIMVSIGTFSWSSIRNLAVHPRSSSIVMVATVITVVWAHNLAIGVLVGVLLFGIFFAGKIAQLFKVTSTISQDGRVRTYVVEGQLFYGSVEAFMNAFDFREALDRVVIDVSGAHIWDISSVQALDMAVLKFRREGAEVEVVGMNAASETIVDKLAVHDKPGATAKLMAH